METSSAFAAVRRKLTGIASGGRVAIARHSLPRGAFCASAGVTTQLIAQQVRVPRTTGRNRSMIRQSPNALCFNVSPKADAAMLVVAPETAQDRGASHDVDARVPRWNSRHAALTRCLR